MIAIRLISGVNSTGGTGCIRSISRIGDTSSFKHYVRMASWWVDLQSVGVNDVWQGLFMNDRESVVANDVLQNVFMNASDRYAQVFCAGCSRILAVSGLRLVVCLCVCLPFFMFVIFIAAFFFPRCPALIRSSRL